MKKIIFFITLVLGILPMNLSAQELQNTGETSCFTYELTADKSTIDTGESIQFSFNYEGTEPICSSEELADMSIQIDFSNLVNEGADISTSYDDEVLSIDIDEDGIATVSFNDLSKSDETVVGFGGSAVFTMVAGEISGDEVVVNDSVGNTVVIPTGPGHGVENTNKISTTDYATVGEVINYTVLINGDENNVTDFNGVDSASNGLAYVPGSFWVEEDGTYTRIEDLFTPSINADGHLEVVNNKEFDSSYLLHYQMEVTDQELTYTNNFDATYDTIVDSVHDDVDFDIDGGSWVDYAHGYITVHKLNAEDKTLAGAEFDLYNDKGEMLEHLVTDEDGTATTGNHEFGTYYLVETKAPDGYVLDETPIEVALEHNGKGNSAVEIDVYNQKIAGQVDLTKVNEDNDALKNVKFTIYDADGNEVEVLKTDKNGYAISEMLSYGDYYLVETKALDGYVLDETEYPFTIANDGEVVHINEGNPIVNQQLTGQVDLTKVNQNGDLLPCVEFTIYDADGNEVEVLTTDADGYAISGDLPYGDYYLVETDALDGYILDKTKYPFTISNDGEVVHINDGEQIVNIECGCQIPEIEVPEIPEIPGIEIPEIELPEIPEVTEPEVPEIEVPEVTEPEVPEVTEPDVTEPEVTEPKVTEPEVTEPEEEKTTDELAETSVSTHIYLLFAAVISLIALLVIKRSHR